MNVYVMHWDVRNRGSGVEVYASREGAVEGLIAAVEDHGGLGEGGGQLTDSELADLRSNVERTGHAFFEDSDCYYSISLEEVLP